MKIRGNQISKVSIYLLCPTQWLIVPRHKGPDFLSWKCHYSESCERDRNNKL